MLQPEDFTVEKVVEETKKLQYLYKQKRVIRSHLTRNHDDVSESVADHVYGMLVLIDYFLPLEDSNLTWDRIKITNLTTYHDIVEIETGDVSTNLKTENDRVKEKKAIVDVFKQVPESMRQQIESVIHEYESQLTPESRFVKAIDKLEPFLQYYDESHRKLFTNLKFTNDDLTKTKLKYIEQFPYMMQFYRVLESRFRDEGYFYPGD